MRWPVLLLLLAAAGAWHHFQRDAEPALHPDDPRIGTADDRIVMLAAEWCDRAMQAIGARGVPTTIIGQQVVRGYDTAALDQGLRKLGYRVY